MKVRTNPKPYARKDIKHKHEVIGFIQLVSYMRGDARPHIEYELKQGWRNKGIMSVELPKFLKKHKQYNPQMIAVVKKDNKASMRLLEKNNFLKISTMDDNYCYIVDLNLTPDIIKKIVSAKCKNFPNQRDYDE